ncbi:MAG TPA: radical SAM protein [Candidatus Fusicatenibacter intestinigallinarum]|uniref:Radical SAM protein n=1 Tax=Candidatus Fusicatenibacter intestinigallinarum TaxID=2838598 RepID=A0A9D2N840_9FIRM|nr:radical SAM protein [Candidatus Fusicatenibacter intestinigallinarum]
MKDYLYVYMKEPSVRVLGPGNRYVLWVQGCKKNCKGCVAASSHRMEDGTKISIGALAMEIALSDADGLTISGGEPFLQAEELGSLVTQIREIRPMGVIVYTGYRMEELQADDRAADFLKKIDLLIDGEYIRELDDGKSLRGSSNQRVWILTDKYRDYVSEYGTKERETEVFYHGIELHEIGIPKTISNRKE